MSLQRIPNILSQMKMILSLGDYMSEQDIMSDKQVLNIIMNKKEIDNKTLDALLYRLCNGGDNEFNDPLRIYTHLYDSEYDSKIISIFSYICKQIWYSVEVLECKHITTDDIKDRVESLPIFPLIAFLEASEFNYFVVVDYEAPDEVYGCDYLLDILEDTCMKRIINKELKQDNINNIVNFIKDLYLFDIELYKEYNEV